MRWAANMGSCSSRYSSDGRKIPQEVKWSLELTAYLL